MDTKLVIVTTIILVLGFCECEKRPHIVFIMADDLGWADVSWNDPDIISPNLEKLYHNSLKLQNYYVYPRCSPSRASTLTGYYAHRLGLQHGTIKHQQPSYLPLGVETFPQKLKQLGYKTAGVGKWHLGFCDLRVTPTYRGFDQFYGMWLGSQHHFHHYQVSNGSEGYDFRDNLDVVYDQKGVYSTHSYSRKAVEIINEHDESEPLYLYLSYLSPHHPLQVPEKYVKMNEGRFTGDRLLKAAMVTALDEGIGNVTKALEERGLMNDTILVFTTDNGGQVQFGGSNFPYRGNKANLYEGGTKAVGFIHGRMFSEGDFNGLFHAVDWYPTLLKPTGHNQSQSTNIDGIDQWENLLTKTETREEFIYNINELAGRAGIRVGQYKLLIGRQSYYDSWYRNASDLEDIYTSKLAVIPKVPGFPRLDQNRTMLFDLENDPYERHDLSSERPDLLQRLYRRLKSYEGGVMPAFWPDEDPAASPAHYNGTWSSGWCRPETLEILRHIN